MPRRPRIVLPGVVHHVTQRGNFRQTVFRFDKDYQFYGELANQYAAKHQVKVYGYCLMPNHVHFIIEPRNEDAMGRMFNTLQMRYAQYVNQRYHLKGHLWQGRYFSCFMDWPYLYNALRYVENNPVRAKMVKRAWEYRYSSAGTHVGSGLGLIAIERILEMDEAQWRDYLGVPDPAVLEHIRAKTSCGSGLGDEKFLSNIEKMTGRTLVRSKRGRPRKIVAQD